ncbi:MAG: N-acetyltransferase, partial [Acidobacteria bacterium]|nr:N-acetyltransferase [Acidobacteriota bacterium]
MSRPSERIRIETGTPKDIPEILAMIRQLAEYERLAPMVTATEAQLRSTLFGEQPQAEVLLDYLQSECVGFALFFRTYSTFLAKPGLWVED